MDSEQVETLFLSAISALNKLPKHKSTVYIGACLSLEVFLPLLKPGQIFSQKNFTSSSTSADVADNFSVCRTKTEGMGSMHFTLENSYSGSFISDVTMHAGEDEVLFLPLHPFRVKSVQARPQSEPNKVPSYDIVLQELQPEKR